MINTTKNKNNKIQVENQVFGEDLNFATKEAYNLLRTNLMFALSTKNGNVVGVSSSCPEEGKSYTSVNLAYSVAKTDKKVLLIEADMRKGNIPKALKIEAKQGLSEILSNQVEDATNKGILHENLSIIFAGSTPPNPSELLGSEKMGEFIKKCSSEYDLVILDLPPVLSVSDALAVSKYLTGIILVVRHKLTQKKELVESTRQLSFANVNILGFVYNDFSVVKKGYKRNYYYKKYYRKHYYRSHYREYNKTEKKEN